MRFLTIWKITIRCRFRTSFQNNDWNRKNPNVAAVIVIGIEPKWTKRIVDEIAKTGKPVEGFHIERTGDIGTIMKASKKLKNFPNGHLKNKEKNVL